MINNLEFSVADYYDVDGIMAIEEKYFSSNGIAYTKEDIIKWMAYNPEMVYVVRDEEKQVKGFTIIVPLTKIGYDKYRNGLVKDLDKLELSDIVSSMESEYYYFADVACDNKNKVASMVLFNNILPILLEKAKYIVTTPVTKEGRNKAVRLYAKNASGDASIELDEPCYIDVEEARKEARHIIEVTTNFLNKGKKR